MTRPVYVEVDSFVAVLTPHFLEALEARANLLPTDTLLRDMFSRMWAVGIEDTCCGFQFGAGYVYFKPKWNDNRGRWELELISYTPDDCFHTHSRNFATRVYP